MILVGIRVEPQIKQMITELQTSKNDSSQILRDLIKIGIQIKENGGYYLKSPFNDHIALEDIEFDKSSIALRFFIDEEQLQRAKIVFSDESQSVLKKAVKLALWSLKDLKKDEKKFIIEARGFYPLIFERPELGEIFDFLAYSQEPVIIVTGYFGSGKSHLIAQALSILQDPSLSAIFMGIERDKQIRYLSKRYTIIPVGKSEDLTENLTKQLLGKPTKKITISQKLLEQLISETASSKPLLITLSMETNQLEEIEWLTRINGIKIIIETTPPIVNEIKNNPFINRYKIINIEKGSTIFELTIEKDNPEIINKTENIFNQLDEEKTDLLIKHSKRNSLDDSSSR